MIFLKIVPLSTKQRPYAAVWLHVHCKSQEIMQQLFLETFYVYHNVVIPECKAVKL